MNRLQTKMDCLHKQLVNGHRSHVGDLMINLFFAFRSTFNGWVSPKMANLRPKMAKCGRLVNVPKSYHFASPANCTLCFQCKKNVSNYNLQKKKTIHIHSTAVLIMASSCVFREPVQAICTKKKSSSLNITPWTR